MIAPIITDNIENIHSLCKKHKVKELYVFGSAARNEMNDRSDVDFIVKFNLEVPVEEHADLYFDFVDALEVLLNRNVDLLTDKPIRNKFLKKDIDETKQLVYNAA